MRVSRILYPKPASDKPKRGARKHLLGWALVAIAVIVGGALYLVYGASVSSLL